MTKINAKNAQKLAAGKVIKDAVNLVSFHRFYQGPLSGVLLRIKVFFVKVIYETDTY